LGTSARAIHNNCYQSSATGRESFNHRNDFPHTLGTNEVALITGFISAFMHNRNKEYCDELLGRISNYLEYLDSFQEYEKTAPTQEERAEIKQALRNEGVTPSETLIQTVYDISREPKEPENFERSAQEVVRKHPITEVENLFEIVEENAKPILNTGMMREDEAIGNPRAPSKGVLEVVYLSDGRVNRKGKQLNEFGKKTVGGTLKGLEERNLIEEVSDSEFNTTWLGDFVGKYLFEDVEVNEFHQMSIRGVGDGIQELLVGERDDLRDLLEHSELDDIQSSFIGEKEDVEEIVEEVREGDVQLLFVKKGNDQEIEIHLREFDGEDLQSLFVEQSQQSQQDVKNILENLEVEEVIEILEDEEDEYPGIYENIEDVNEVFTSSAQIKSSINVMLRKAEDLNTL